MIIVLKAEASVEHAFEISSSIAAKGCRPLPLSQSARRVIGAIGEDAALKSLKLDSHPMVESVRPIATPYKLVHRAVQPHDTLVRVGGTTVGGEAVVIVGGPCAVENAEQLRATAHAVKSGGAAVLRGGAFKPRTSPYAFQGLGVEGLKLLQAVGAEVGLPTVTEVVDAKDVAAIVEHCDCLQIGARNMQNFELLKEVGQARKPVLLKRGMAAKIEDLLLAAEYVVAGGNRDVILCERGIRTFETATRNTLDLNAIPFLKERSHLPVLVDPSHGTGIRDFVLPMAKAAVACGADGVIIEVHHDPKVALCDGPQSLYPEQFHRLVREVRPVAEAIGRSLA
jgi:3-deoxy-7-phosphoheptulonate synthase